MNLDQVVDAITTGKEDYKLKEFFHLRLTNLDEIAYRHEVTRDLERDELLRGIRQFSVLMRQMRTRLAASEKSYYRYQKEALFLEAAGNYCEAVQRLLQVLRDHTPTARGLIAFQNYLSRYVLSSAFLSLAEETKARKTELSQIRYAVLIKGSRVTVRNYDSQPDYTAAVEKVFTRFKQGATQDYLVKFSELSGMNHVEAMVLDRVALLNPGVFRALDEFFERQRSFPDRTIADFDREIQFYVAWLEYAAKLKRSGLQFCYPRISGSNKEISAHECFDLALAGKAVRDNSPVVTNDFALSGSERIVVASGPNQGGKTTFARMVGQLHFMASLGLPVPGTGAQLFLCDQIFTHFERAEDITTLRGKLEDDLFRIQQILQKATPNSLIIINEIFSSTALKDAVFLGSKVIDRITKLDALCVCVTFLDELSRLNEKVISMAAEVVPNNPMQRTFKIRRRPADGLAYALAIADKYRLTYERLKERLSS